MSETLIVFLVFLLFLSAMTRETFVIVLIYLGVGAFLLSRWWSDRVMNNLKFNRKFDKNAFLDETVCVEIEIENRSILPAVWLRVQDFYPIDVAEFPRFQQIITLGPRERQALRYSLKTRKRGYYAIGPLEFTNGDLLGLSSEKTNRGKSDFLTVYPRVQALTNPFLPSNSPMGTLPHHQPIFEDPSRPAGKRDYQPGDSLRRIDWKATAGSGRLQVKIFEPSIALDTAIFLNLNFSEYNSKDWISGTELAIEAAASLANWIISKRQSTGLYTNGVDQAHPEDGTNAIPARKGRAHLMRILESLARVKALETTSLAQLIRRHRAGLPWGTTIILLTGSANQQLFDELIQCKRAGMSVVMILCGWYTGIQEIRQKAKTAGIQIMDLPDENAFKMWQR